MSKMKNKSYSVTVHLSPGNSHSYLVRAQTQAGAKKIIMQTIAALVESDLATGEQLYAAGVAGQVILGAEDVTDRAQMPLQGFPMTPEQEATTRMEADASAAEMTIAQIEALDEELDAAEAADSGGFGEGFGD